MRKVLLLSLCWGLSWGEHHGKLAAQSRPAGPWRVVSQPVRYKLNEEWGDKPSPTAKADTTTAVRGQRKLSRVPWNVHPDSITLFLDCQNPLIAPPLPRGQLATVRFKTIGATVRLDSKRHLLLLMPTAPTVLLWAYRGQQLIFRHEFKAVPPPLPTIKCFANPCSGVIHKPVREERYLRAVTLRAIPNVDFAQMLPEDARYRVARFRATLLRQGKAVELLPGQPTERTVQGPAGDMSDLTSSSQLGDQLQLDILLVQRMNAQDIITEVSATRQLIIDDLKCPRQD
jgi:hypothetical protein